MTPRNRPAGAVELDQVEFADLNERAGFTATPNPILLDTSLSASALRTYQVIRFHARSTEGCFASVATLAAEVGVSKNTLRKSIRELERAGNLEVEQRRNGPKNLSNVYLLKPPTAHQLEAFERGFPRSGAKDEPGSSSPELPSSTIEPSGSGVEHEVDVKEIDTTESELGSRTISSSSPGSCSPNVRAVWKHWVDVMSPSKKDPSRSELVIIKDALEVATVEECCTAITELEASDWHQMRGEYSTRDGSPCRSLRHALRGNSAEGISNRDRIDEWLDRSEERAGGKGDAYLESLNARADAVLREQGLLDEGREERQAPPVASGTVESAVPSQADRASSLLRELAESRRPINA